MNVEEAHLDESLSPAIVPPGDEPPATRASVATEMEAIFAGAGPRPLPPGRAVAAQPVISARGGRFRAPLVAGALVLAAGGAVFGVRDWRGREAASPSPVPATKTIALATPIPAQALPRPVVAAVTPAAPPSVAPPAIPSPVPATVRPVVPAVSERPRPMASPREDYADEERDFAPGPRGGPCAGLRGRGRYACTLDALAAADGRLRRAYDSAVVTGVPRRELLATRERWASLRRSAARRPFFVIAAYQDLADDLEAASSRAQ